MNCWRRPLVTALAVLLAPAAYAQTFPAKPIRIIVPFAPGGGNDVLGRMFAARINESTGQSVIVDNRAGGGGNIGTEMAARAPADGYTLLYTTNSLAVAPALYTRLSYRIEDLAPVSLVANFPIVIVTHPSVPAKSVKELVALAKQRGGLNYGSTGAGSTNHLTGVLLNNVSGTQNVHVPYKGAGPMMTAILSGEIEIAIATAFTATPYVRSGRLRALAVTSGSRARTLPDVPTMASYYPGFDTSLWHGFLTASGTPPNVIAALNREIVKAVKSAEVHKALDDGGADAVGSTPAQFATVIAQDVEKYAKLVRIAGVKVD
jgi:tripartite-type tricarboxylate transporter receptor subunit TctC